MHGHSIGLIGLGRTGLPLALNLRERGHDVVGFRRSDASAFVAGGGRLVKSPRAVAEATDVVLTCLPSASALEEVMVGEGGMLAALGPRHVVAEVGSMPLAVKERWRAALAERGAAFVDGEISGTPAMTAARVSVVLLAGDRDVCTRLVTLCKDASDHCIYAGDFGAATKLKLVANVLVAVHTAAAAEAMLLVERSGLDKALAIEVLGLGAGASTMLRQRAGSMAARKFVDPAPGPVAMLAAYLDPIRELAQSASSPTPLFDIASDLLRSAVAEGKSSHDIGCVIDQLDAHARKEKSR